MYVYTFIYFNYVKRYGDEWEIHHQNPPVVYLSDK